MLSPLSWNLNSARWQTDSPSRTADYQRQAPAGRTQTAPQDPASLGRMLPVSGKEEAQGGVRTDRDKKEECQTCRNRKYQDGSDDPGVSFKTAGKIDPDAAPSVVRAHEQEHVVRERAKAAREGRKVVSQSVSIHTSVCPECGRIYVSGGTTRTVTRGDNTESRRNAFAQDPAAADQKGSARSASPTLSAVELAKKQEETPKVPDRETHNKSFSAYA